MDMKKWHDHEPSDQESDALRALKARLDAPSRIAELKGHLDAAVYAAIEGSAWDRAGLLDMLDEATRQLEAAGPRLKNRAQRRRLARRVQADIKQLQAGRP
jgi:hypothetical protein